MNEKELAAINVLLDYDSPYPIGSPMHDAFLDLLKVYRPVRYKRYLERPTKVEPSEKEDAYNRVMERVNEHQVANDPNYTTISFQLEGTQPPSRTLMELTYEEEAELIRAATNLTSSFLGSEKKASFEPSALKDTLLAACEFLTSKFKEATNAESD